MKKNEIPNGQVIGMKAGKYYNYNLVIGVIFLLLGIGILTYSLIVKQIDYLVIIANSVFILAGAYSFIYGVRNKFLPNAVIIRDDLGYYILSKGKYVYLKFEEIDDIIERFSRRSATTGNAQITFFIKPDGKITYTTPCVENYKDTIEIMRKDVPLFKFDK